MFQMFELLSDLHNLREAGLTEEEIEGYLEIFFETYKEIVSSTEVV
jgi:orotate phosphoribosyltransferase-like protein